MSKITVFECDTCKREIELALDDRRPYPARCIITYKCIGHMQSRLIKQTRKELFPPIVYGLQDYIQRGTVLSQLAAPSTSPTVSLLAGKNTLVLAATSLGVANVDFVNDSADVTNVFVSANVPLESNQLSTVDGQFLNYPTDTAKLFLDLYELPADTTTFFQYYYTRGQNTQLVTGVDDTPDHLLLRFDPAVDRIRVIVNGIELTPAVDYVAQVTIGGEFIINFTPLLVAASNVIKVLVYKAPINLTDATKVRTLTFTGKLEDDQTRRSYSWGDTLEITINSLTRYLWICQDISPLTLNSRYLIKSVRHAQPDVILYLHDLYLLFGDSPWSFIDKSRDLVVSLQDSFESSYEFQYLQDEFAEGTLYLAQDNLTSLAQSVMITKETSVPLTDSRDQVNYQNTGVSSNYIIGYV